MNRIEKIMRKRADKQNTTHSFTSLHGSVWFVFGMVLGLCSLVGCWSDGEVLYSILYNSTSQPIYSIIKAALGAVLIQVLIWGGWTLFFKMWLHGKYKDDNGNWDWLNIPHMIIYLLLGLCGFHATFYLSTQTHSPLLLKTKIQHQHHHNAHSQQLATLDSLGDKSLEDLRREYVKDSTMIQNRYNALIYTDTITPSHKIQTYQGRFERGEISERKRDKKVGEYKRRINEGMKKHIPDREREMKELNHNYKRAVDSCKQITVFAIADVKEAGVKVGDELKDNTVLAGSVLIGKNLVFNSISIILILGLQFFYKGVNATTKPPSNPNPQINLIPFLPSVGMMDGATQQDTTPSNGGENEGDVLEVPTLHPTTPKIYTKVPKELWGTIEGNKDNEWRCFGEVGKRTVKMAYLSKGRVRWMDKKAIKSEKSNRANKIALSSNEKAKKNNEAWFNFWCEKLEQIGEYERKMFDRK